MAAHEQFNHFAKQRTYLGVWLTNKLHRLSLSAIKECSFEDDDLGVG